MIEPQIQIIPLRILALNRIDLPNPAPSLHLLFPADRVIHIPELLKIDQLRNIIFRGKVTPNLALMLIYPPRKIIRHTSIKRPARLTRQYVHEVRHGSSLTITTRPHNHPNTPSSFEGPPHRSRLNGREDNGACGGGQWPTTSLHREPSKASINSTVTARHPAQTKCDAGTRAPHANFTIRLWIPDQRSARPA